MLKKLLFSLSIIILATLSAQEAKMAFNNIFPRGEELKSPNFNKRVWVERLSEKDEVFNCPIANVTFEPGCRNVWHRHPGGQILLCTAGKGYYQEKGKPPQVLRPGDVVRIAPNVIHWHGAATDSWFAHLSIETNSSAGPVEWLDAVTGDEYENQLKQTAPARNSGALFSVHAATDPELAEIFGNFAFGETMKHGSLDTKTRLMMILSSSIASQAPNVYKMALNAALEAGVTPVEAKELLYQAVPYVGMSKVYDFVSATNEVMTARGIVLPLESQSTTSRENRFEKGLAVQKSIFGERIEQMYKLAPANQRHIQHYLSANCFGDYLTRKGLSVQTRELLTFSMLLSLGGCESQLKSHIQGNLNVGNSKEKMLEAVTQLIPFVGYPRALNAIACLNEVVPETK